MMLSDYLYDNWSDLATEASLIPSFQTMDTLPSTDTFDLNRIKWNSWFSGAGDFTVKLKEQYTFINQTYPDSMFGSIGVFPYGGKYHTYHSAVDIHIFQRTKQRAVTPIEIAFMSRNIASWLEQRPFALQDDGIMQINVDNVQEVSTGYTDIWHWIITVSLYYMKTDLVDGIVNPPGPLVSSIGDTPDR